MKLFKLIVAAGLAVGVTGAFAETGVSTGGIGHVATVYGRASAPAVKIAEPAAILPADLDVADRNAGQGPGAMVVSTGETNVSEIFGRT
ncbi:MAG: hypothetical protein ABI728_13975 [Betaproteobacteria bacterium]